MCWATGLIFPVLWLLEGEMQSPALLWQPAVIGGLFVTGQLLTLIAIRYGDVSIAAPVQGVKVLLVPLAAIVVVGEAAPLKIWIASSIAMLGIMCVQSSDATVHRKSIWLAVLLAFLASVSMTIFDLLIQRWAPPWGPGRFLPLMAVFTALLASLLMPLADHPREVLRNRQWWLPLAGGSLLMALQAIGMTFTLAKFGDATRVNIVYSLRGIWGVLLTWWLIHSLPPKPNDSRPTDQAPASDQDPAPGGPSHRVMVMRLIGAVLIGLSVVISLTDLIA